MRILLISFQIFVTLLLTATAFADSECAEQFCDDYSSYMGVLGCSTAGLYQCADNLYVAESCSCEPTSPGKSTSPRANSRILTAGKYHFKGGPGFHKTKTFLIQPYLKRFRAHFQHNQTGDIPYFKVLLLNRKGVLSSIGASCLRVSDCKYSPDKSDEEIRKILRKTKGARYLQIHATGSWNISIN